MIRINRVPQIAVVISRIAPTSEASITIPRVNPTELDCNNVVSADRRTAANDHPFSEKTQIFRDPFSNQRISVLHGSNEATGKGIEDREYQ